LIYYDHFIGPGKAILVRRTAFMPVYLDNNWIILIVELDIWNATSS